MWSVVKRINWKQTPYYMMYLAAFMMIGMFDFANGRFDPSRIATAQYWQSVTTLMMASILILLAAANKKIQTLEMEDTEIQEKEKMFSKLAVSADLDRLDSFLTELNLERKKHMYIQGVKKKVQRLEKGIWLFRWMPWVGASVRDMMLYNTNNPEMESVKAKNRYCRKRTELDYLMSDEYILPQLETMRVRYPKISRSFVTTGVEDNNELPWITQSKAWKMFKDLSPRFMFSVGFGAFITSFIPELGIGMTWGLAFGIAVKTTVLISNHIGGIEYGPVFVKTKTKKDLQSRFEIAVKYDEWRKVNGTKLNA